MRAPEPKMSLAVRPLRFLLPRCPLGVDKRDRPDGHRRHLVHQYVNLVRLKAGRVSTVGADRLAATSQCRPATAPMRHTPVVLQRLSLTIGPNEDAADVGQS